MNTNTVLLDLNKYHEILDVHLIQSRSIEGLRIKVQELQDELNKRWDVDKEVFERLKNNTDLSLLSIDLDNGQKCTLLSSYYFRNQISNLVADSIILSEMRKISKWKKWLLGIKY